MYGRGFPPGIRSPTLGRVTRAPQAVSTLSVLPHSCMHHAPLTSHGHAMLRYVRLALLLLPSSSSRARRLVTGGAALPSASFVPPPSRARARASARPSRSCRAFSARLCALRFLRRSPRRRSRALLLALAHSRRAACAVRAARAIVCLLLAPPRARHLPAAHANPRTVTEADEALAAASACRAVARGHTQRGGAQPVPSKAVGR